MRAQVRTLDESAPKSTVTSFARCESVEPPTHGAGCCHSNAFCNGELSRCIVLCNSICDIEMPADKVVQARSSRARKSYCRSAMLDLACRHASMRYTRLVLLLCNRLCTSLTVAAAVKYRQDSTGRLSMTHACAKASPAGSMQPSHTRLCHSDAKLRHLHEREIRFQGQATRHCASP